MIYGYVQNRKFHISSMFMMFIYSQVDSSGASYSELNELTKEFFGHSVAGAYIWR